MEGKNMSKYLNRTLTGKHISIGSFIEMDKENCNRKLFSSSYEAQEEVEEEEPVPAADSTDFYESHRIRLLPDYVPVGVITLQGTGDNELEIDVVLIRECENKGYGPEAIQLLGNYLHDEYGLNRLLVRTLSGDLQKRRAIEKTGAHFEREEEHFYCTYIRKKHPDHELPPDTKMMYFWYSIPLPVREIKSPSSPALDENAKREAQFEFWKAYDKLAMELRKIILEEREKKAESIFRETCDAIRESIEELRIEA